MPELTSKDVGGKVFPRQGDVCHVCDGEGTREIFNMTSKVKETQTCPECGGSGAHVSRENVPDQGKDTSSG